ncbi:MAG: hypothetical protein CMA77_02955 [Euryarchaeota archaeon]|nr:hypothetical protein [Euryarchaeota archaeon]
MESLDDEQREMLLGSSLSQRFAAWPLSISHPAIVGAFYGLLLTIALILPYGMLNDWEISLWSKNTAFMGLSMALGMAIAGQISALMNRIVQRPPIAPPRVLLFSAPFVGFAALIGLWMEILPQFPEIIAWIILILPGPIYVHLSWAPRHRMLTMLEDGINPFNITSKIEVGEREKERELEEAVDALED